MRVSLLDLPKMQESNRKQWHKKLLRQNPEKAIRTIKKGIPEGRTLKEYLDELNAEIQKEDSKKQDV